jgi:hypothetical protein
MTVSTRPQGTASSPPRIMNRASIEEGPQGPNPWAPPPKTLSKPASSVHRPILRSLVTKLIIQRVGGTAYLTSGQGRRIGDIGGCRRSCLLGVRGAEEQPVERNSNLHRGNRLDYRDGGRYAKTADFSITCINGPDR